MRRGMNPLNREWKRAAQVAKEAPIRYYDSTHTDIN